MGCGSSSLKGEKVPDLGTEPAPQPIKKVRTNFSEVDYEAKPSGARRNTEYAPTDIPRRPTTVTEEHQAAPMGDGPYPPDRTSASSRPDQILSKQDGFAEPRTEMRQDGPGAGTALQPYRSIEGENELESPTQTKAPVSQPHHANPPPQDPTSSDAKASFALQNQPYSNQESRRLGSSSSDKRKKSLYERYQDKKTGRDNKFTDEELKQYTGKTRDELQEWAKDAPDVGGNQSVSKIAMGPASGASGGYNGAA